MGDGGKLDNGVLHSAIDSPVHRQHLLAYRFLVQRIGDDAAQAARDLGNEARRLRVVLDRASGKPYELLLNEFVEALLAKGTAARTLRLYTGVAQTFCERIGADSRSGWEKGAVLVFLQHTPGVAASLSPFVGFCRRQKGWDVSIPSKQVRREMLGAGQHAADRLRKALDLVKGRSVSDLKLLEVVRVISAATGLSSRSLVSAHVAIKEGTGASIRLDADAEIAPGHPLHPYADHWRHLLSLRNRGGVGPGTEAA